MTTFGASLTKLSDLLLQSYDCSYCVSYCFDCRNTLIYARTNSSTLPNCVISLGLLTLPVSEAGNFMELILPYTTDRIWVKWRAKRPGRFTFRRNISGSYWVTSCVGLKCGLGAVKKKTHAPTGTVTMISRLSTLYLVSILTESSKHTVLQE
jgi:hypothetical protein